MPDVDVGTGTSIVFASSGFTAQLTSIDPYELSRESIETSHLGTTGPKTSEPGDLYDPGELALEGHFNPETAPPISGVAETATITYPSGATDAFTCYMTNYKPGVPLEDKMTFSATFKITSAITRGGTVSSSSSSSSS